MSLKNNRIHALESSKQLLFQPDNPEGNGERGAQPVQFLADAFVAGAGGFVFDAFQAFPRVGDDDTHVNLVGVVGGEKTDEVAINKFVTGKLDFNGNLRFVEVEILRVQLAFNYFFFPAFSRKFSLQVTRN